MKLETQSILALTDNKTYDEYNAILPIIKQKLGDRTPIFVSTLVEELPLTTCRRAYRTAIMVACGEDKVYREIVQQRAINTFKRVKKGA